MRAIDSHANVVLLNPLRPVSEVLPISKKTTLSPRRFPRWDNYIRVSLGTPAEMQEFWRVCKMEK
jgi:histidinol-phosphate/aromatic aminotransferase/cobyric acid decarboxylase-like protein